MKRFLAPISILFLLFSIYISSAEAPAERPQYQISVTVDSVFLGDIIIELYPETAPEHCRNFDSLASIGFFDGTAFHRIIPGVLIQGGDPNTQKPDKKYWGMGNSSQRKIKAEFSDIPHVRGIISAARTTDPNSHTSQFFICLRPLHALDKQYTVFGSVIEGMEIADKISQLPRDNNEMPISKVEIQVCKRD